MFYKCLFLKNKSLIADKILLFDMGISFRFLSAHQEILSWSILSIFPVVLILKKIFNRDLGWFFP